MNLNQIAPLVGVTKQHLYKLRRDNSDFPKADGGHYQLMDIQEYLRGDKHKEIFLPDGWAERRVYLDKITAKRLLKIVCSGDFDIEDIVNIFNCADNIIFRNVNLPPVESLGVGSGYRLLNCGVLIIMIRDPCAVSGF